MDRWDRMIIIELDEWEILTFHGFCIGEFLQGGACGIRGTLRGQCLKKLQCTIQGAFSSIKTC